MGDIDTKGMTFDGAKNGLAATFALYSGDPELVALSGIDMLVGAPNSKYKGLARFFGTALGPIGLGLVRADPRKIVYGAINAIEGIYQTVTYRS